MGAVITWLETHMLPCMIKWATGLDCPGCGMQRAFVSLLKGDLAQSFELFPPLLPMMLMVTLLVVHLVFKLKHGAAALKYIFIFNTIILLLNYIIKMFHHAPGLSH